jgi:serine protease DegQ
VKNAQVMLDLIAALPPGATSRFELRREGRDVLADVSVGKRPPPRRE